MKALSIQQPWAWAIMYAGKRVENRSWPTRFRGTFLIHAGMKYDEGAVEVLADEIRAIPEPRPPAVRGALLATARLVDCARPESVRPDQRPWVVGPWCFILEDITPLAVPIRYKGALGFFEVPVHAAGGLATVVDSDEE